MSNNSVWVILPTYNEKENILEVIDKILALDNKSIEVLVVDDNSPDKTASLVEERAKNTKRIHLITRKKDRGRGLAGREGYRFALNKGAKYIVEMDADLSHDPRDIKKLLAAIEDYGAVVGSRYVRGGSDTRKSAWRHLLSGSANWLVRVLLGLKLRDCNSGFRCFKATALREIVDELQAKGPEIVQEALYLLNKKGFGIGEVPISFVDRQKGKSKLTNLKLVKVLLNTIKLRCS